MMKLKFKANLDDLNLDSAAYNAIIFAIEQQICERFYIEDTYNCTSPLNDFTLDINFKIEAWDRLGE